MEEYFARQRRRRLIAIAVGLVVAIVAFVVVLFANFRTNSNYRFQSVADFFYQTLTSRKLTYDFVDQNISEVEVLSLIHIFCEWETGRLTPRTKEEALYCLSLYQETVEQRLAAGPNERLSDMLQFFRETQEMLLSPLPEAKKISKPYARKCPWREEVACWLIRY